MLVSFDLAALPGVVAQEGICPNYYGPFDPDLSGNSSCGSAIPAGTFTLRWAHGNESNWSWEDLAQVEMKANVRYILIYNQTAQLELAEYDDLALNETTGLCFANLGPDAFAVCLNPQMGTNAQGPGSQQGNHGQQVQLPPGQGGLRRVPNGESGWPEGTYAVPGAGFSASMNNGGLNKS